MDDTSRNPSNSISQKNLCLHAFWANQEVIWIIQKFFVQFAYMKYAEFSLNSTFLNSAECCVQTEFSTFVSVSPILFDLKWGN